MPGDASSMGVCSEGGSTKATGERSGAHSSVGVGRAGWVRSAATG